MNCWNWSTTWHGWWFYGIRLLVGGVLLSSLASRAAQHLDVLVYRSGDSARVAGYDFGTSTSLADYTVFSIALTVEPALPGLAYTQSPGWNALRNANFLPPGGVVLPGGASVGFNALAHPAFQRDLSYWSGTGIVAFTQVPAGEVLQIRKGAGTGGAITLDGSNTNVPGYTVGTASGGGYLHVHIAFNLYGNAGVQDTSPDAPTPGVYLTTLEATVNSLAPSQPFWLLFGHQVPAATLAQAAAWLDTTVAHPARLSINKTESGNFLILHGAPGRNYRLDVSTNLATWTPYTNITAASPSTTRFLPPMVQPQSFYRVAPLLP